MKQYLTRIEDIIRRIDKEILSYEIKNINERSCIIEFNINIDNRLYKCKLEAIEIKVRKVDFVISIIHNNKLISEIDASPLPNTYGFEARLYKAICMIPKIVRICNRSTKEKCKGIMTILDENNINYTTRTWHDVGISTTEIKMSNSSIGIITEYKNTTKVHLVVNPNYDDYNIKYFIFNRIINDGSFTAAVDFLLNEIQY